MRRYRRRPVEVQAIQFTGETENVAEILAEVGDRAAFASDGPGRAHMVIAHPREGHLVVDRGDWIIKTERGEVYPCPAAEFERVYEAVA